MNNREPPTTLRLLACVAGLAALAGCARAREIVIVDDYRDSWAVVQGRVIDNDGRPAAGAKVWLAPVRPPFARGDTVITGSDGGYLVHVTSFGVSSFFADVRVYASATSGASADTLIAGLFVAERDRGVRPDSLSVNLHLRR